MVSLKLIFQNITDSESLELLDRDGIVDFQVTNLYNFTIETKINLPNIIYIKTHNYNTTLKELWLGNIKATDSMLDQICCYTVDNQSKYTTHWPTPGITKIEFFDPSFIEFHLHFGNNLKHHLYSGS